MSHVARLSLRNWERFRGEHVLDLGPIAYALVARDQGDPNRSNWLGKSSVARAIRFALYGAHEHRLEDDWISHGEQEGGVALSLSDGHFIERLRKRGKRTSLSCGPMRDVGSAAQDSAQQGIVREVVGLSLEDFEATSYFAQGEMASHVRMKPEPRFQVVAGWVQLGKLEAAEAFNRGRMRSLIVQRAEEVQRVDMLEREAMALPGADDLELVDIEKRLGEARVKLGEANDRLQRVAEATRVLDRAHEHKLLVAEFNGLQQAGNHRGGREAYDRAVRRREEANAAFQAALREERQKLALVHGEFDGRCPVAHIECPAREEINRRVRQNESLHEQANAELESRREQLDAASDAARKAEAEWQAGERRAQRSADLRRRMQELEPYVEQADRVGALDQEGAYRAHESLSRRVAELTAGREAWGQRRARLETVKRELSSARRRLGELDRQLVPLREAAAVLGRQGAQRAIAEGALAEVEARANDRLRRAGISLSVAVRWEQEGRDPARACGACGEPFPASKGVRECTRCGEPRGKHLVSRLEYELSHRSGAADDLVGIAIRLAASGWLRRRRGSGWSVAILDEPMGQLDRANRRWLGQALGQMLRGEFEQSLVIAHDASTLDALPGRIEVVGQGEWSAVRVVA